MSKTLGELAATTVGGGYSKPDANNSMIRADVILPLQITATLTEDLPTAEAVQDAIVARVEAIRAAMHRKIDDAVEQYFGEVDFKISSSLKFRPKPAAPALELTIEPVPNDDK